METGDDDDTVERLRERQLSGMWRDFKLKRTPPTDEMTAFAICDMFIQTIAPAVREFVKEFGEFDPFLARQYRLLMDTIKAERAMRVVEQPKFTFGDENLNDVYLEEGFKIMRALSKINMLHDSENNLTPEWEKKFGYTVRLSRLCMEGLLNYEAEVCSRILEGVKTRDVYNPFTGEMRQVYESKTRNPALKYVEGAALKVLTTFDQIKDLMEEIMKAVNGVHSHRSVGELLAVLIVNIWVARMGYSYSEENSLLRHLRFPRGTLFKLARRLQGWFKHVVAHHERWYDHEAYLETVSSQRSR